MCENNNPVTRVEVRPSAGIDLPPGYGSNIPQNNDPSNFPGATPINTPTTLLPGGISNPTDTTTYKVWQVLLIALIPLLLVLVLGCFLT
jgi:hypothetical protein